MGSIQSCNEILVWLSIEGFAAVALSDTAAAISSSFFIWFLFTAYDARKMRISVRNGPRLDESS